MIRYYETLDKLLKENNFDINNSTIVDNHILSTNNNGITYICHFTVQDNLYTLDNCKPYKNKDEALGIMIKLIVKGFDDEER